MTTNLNIPAGDQSITSAPIANGLPANTLSSVTVNGTTLNGTQREFLVNIGLNSDKGAPGHGGVNANDKVSLYSGLQALPGTADVWSLYTVLGLNTNSGTYNAQGYELDFNNHNKHVGNNGSLGVDFFDANGKIALGMSITGSSVFTSTTGLMISSQSGSAAPQWARGITTVGTMSFCAWQDITTCPVGIQFDGSYSTAVLNLTSVHGNPGALGGGAALFMRNGHTVSWQNNATNNVISDAVDSGNLRLVGVGSAGCFMGGITAPLVPGTNLGTSSNWWGQVFSTGGIVSPSDLSLKSDVKPLPAMTEAIKNVTPIQFKWRDESRGDKVSYGFDAQQIHEQFGDFAGHVEQDGVQYLAKDQLISVLWKANQEMLARIEILENQSLS